MPPTSSGSIRRFVTARAVAVAVVVIAALAGLGAEGLTDSAARLGARAVAGPVGALAAQGAGRDGAVGPSSARPRDVHVVRMVPRGYHPDPQSTPEAVSKAVAGASAYWSEQTSGEISFRVVSISDWVPSGHGCGDPSALWGEALDLVPQAASREAHLVVVAPRAAGEEGSGCDYGYGSLGVRDSGGSVYVTALHPALLAHELGHNLGLGHAGALECAAAQDGGRIAGVWTRGCEVRQYDDLYDVMGYSGEGFGGGYLGAVGVDALRADPDAFRRVHASTSGVRLAPISAVGRGVRFLAVEVPGEATYYAEYRTGAGRDASLAGGAWHPSTGVRILRADPDGSGGSLELDTTPGGRRYDRALQVGRTFVGDSGRIRITLVGADAQGATLDVEVRPR